ncbi:D-sedoheptulose 7-phosphate isomerase [Sporomusaceae bacterium BoRhaA]|uniref:D-sedoheptulose-7-phosphate isomerase n=1 Tax=Pelorhabdus rhamnosifermentans TaxID=2772457 RepID=UPI0028AF2E53|nr:D-sedoheptulose 7-phosphate isomerase [Pelorhabdus rhamnosifermentans]MBU2699018.1 D-sedoheptulose 7-phosphate isomerase [Pelorhabdus rhamnosifermentans]
MILSVLEQHLDTISQLKGLTQEIATIAKTCSQALKAGKRIYLMGNGGSAADSQHIAAEFVGRFQIERQPLPALAFTTDTSLLTAVGNDYGFDEVFARQVRAFVQPGDVVIGISTSGNSGNILKAMACAQEQGGVTIAFTGQGGGKLANCCDYCLAVPSPVTARVQEAHILIGHIICQYVDEVLYGAQ